MHSSDGSLSCSQVSEKPQQIVKVDDSFAVLTNPQFSVVPGNFSVTIRTFKQHINSPKIVYCEAAKYEFLSFSSAQQPFFPAP
jgi:hypothetical protein